MARDPNTVLIVNPGADLYGSDRMVLESVRALVGAGYRAVVVVPGPGPLVALLKDAGATVKEQATPIMRRGLLSVRGLAQLAREAFTSLVPSWRLLRDTGAGTVLVNTITPPLWLPLARMRRCRVVCHVHEAESTAPALLRRALYLPLVFCHGVVVNSRFTLGVLAKSAPWLRRRASTVYNAVVSPDEVTAARDVLSAPVRILYVGRLSERKGPQLVVEAIRLLLDRGLEVHLTLLGAVFPGNEAFEVGLHEQVRRLDLENRVTWLGFKSDVWPHFADCDLVVIPSLVDESFGNTAVEASLAGRPLIVSDVAGLKEATQEAQARIAVPVGNSEAIASAVMTIKSDWVRFRELAAMDAAQARQSFSRERYARGLLSAIGLTRV